MQWNDLFFNVNFDESIQRGINEFARSSGYQKKETEQVAKNKLFKTNSTSRLLLVRFLIAVLLAALLLSTCNKNAEVNFEDSKTPLCALYDNRFVD